MYGLSKGGVLTGSPGYVSTEWATKQFMWSTFGAMDSAGKILNTSGSNYRAINLY